MDQLDEQRLIKALEMIEKRLDQINLSLLPIFAALVGIIIVIVLFMRP